MKLRLLSAALALSFMCTAAAQADPPKREFRSSWVAGMGIDWPKSKDQATAKKQLITYLDKFKAQNMTGVCIHVRPRADAYYKSSYEPWSADLTGTRGKDPGWDPLAFAIEECHKRGLECYAWINPYRVNADNVTYTTSFDKEWDNNGWLIRSRKWTSFNPGHPGARQHCFDVIKEIYTNYNIDGMLFDDYFYPGNGMQGVPAQGWETQSDSDADDYEMWENAKSGMTLYNWRRNNVNTFVKELYDMIQETRPDLRFGIGPAGVVRKSASLYNLKQPAIKSGDWQYDKIYSDPLKWLADGSIDFISPQVYWSTTNADAPFRPLAEWYGMVAKHFNRHNYISIAAYKLHKDYAHEFGGNNENGWLQIQTQLECTRTYNQNEASGIIYYNTQSVNGPALTGLGDWMGEHCFQRPALVPKVTWKDRVVYSAPESAEHSNGVIKWKATTGAPKAIIRYTVYAVPSTVNYSDALASDGDGIDGKYLQSVVYGTSYTLPADAMTNHWYAVCVYDGYGYESEPALINYNGPGSGIIGVTDENSTELSFTVNGRSVMLDSTAKEIRIYSADGSLLGSATDSDEITLPAAGLYIIWADGVAAKTAVK